MQKLKELIRFCIVGVIATGIHYGMYLLLMRIMMVNIAYSIGYIVSFFVNFFLSAYFSFKSAPSLKKGLGFGLSHLINYSLHILLLNFFIWLQIPANIAPIPVFCIVIPVNFVLVRFVFKSKIFNHHKMNTI